MSEIVVGVDGSEGSRAALAWAVDEAALRGDEVVAVAVGHPYAEPAPGTVPGQDLWDARNELRERTAKLLDRVLAPHAGGDVVLHPLPLLEPSASGALLERAAGATALVVGSHGTSGHGWLTLGSVSQHVVVHARGPVVVVPPPGDESDREQKVVVGIDGSTGARAALVRAAEEARLRGLALELVAVQPPLADFERQRPSAVGEWREHVERLLAEELEAAYTASPSASGPEDVTTTMLVDRHPARGLLDVARRAQLLVVGSRGYGGFVGMLLGSVSQHCVRHATSPVLMVPSVRADGGPK